MIVVDDSSALDDAEGGPYLRLGPSSGLGDADQDRRCAALTRKGVSLRRSETEFPVPGVIGRLFGRGVFGDTAPAVILRTHVGFRRFSSGKEGQQKGYDERREFHILQR